MKTITIECPLCNGCGLYTIYYKPKSDKDKRILIKKLLSQGMTQTEISKEIGISRQRVWQLLR